MGYGFGSVILAGNGLLSYIRLERRNADSSDTTVDVSLVRLKLRLETICLPPTRVLLEASVPRRRRADLLDRERGPSSFSPGSRGRPHANTLSHEQSSMQDQ
jgi:hypothetical protein